MAQLFKDDFSSYTPGSDNPDGWVDIGAFAGQVANLNGLFGRSGHAYEFGLGGPLMWTTTNVGTPLGVSNTTVNWESAGTNQDNVALTLGLSTVTNSFVQAWLQFTMEPDHSASVYITSTLSGAAGAHLLGNTGNAYFNEQLWQPWQMTAGAGIQVVGTITYIAVNNITLWYAGTLLLNIGGPFVTTNVYDGIHSNINAFQFSKIGPPSGDAWVTDVAAVDSILGTWTSPFQGTGVVPAARMSQGVVEVQKRYGSSVIDVRMTQGVVEVQKLPNSNTRNIRMTQGVVEIIKRNAATGWRVYES